MFRKISDSWKFYWWGTGLFPNRSNRIEDINLRYYNGKTVEDYVDVPLNLALTLFNQKSKRFEKNQPTVLYIHGYKEVAQKESINVVISAYLETKPNFNVVLLDWSNMSHGSYLFNAVRNTKKVGEAVALELNKLLENGLSLDGVHIIGHSLGSHVAGYIARELEDKCNKRVKRVTALDPAFPAFYPDGIFMTHIKASDAEFVDVIHTDGGLYGAPVATGTADFWPNGGKSIQPGCPKFAPIPLTKDNLCSHWRSWRFYAESVRNPEAFPALPAKNYKKFVESPNRKDNIVYMGLKCDASAKGSYYLTTNAQEPFGKGMDGIYIQKKDRTNR